MSQSQTGFPSRPRTVLHADDSPAVRRWVAEQLLDMGLTVLSVADGDEALAVLRRSDSRCDLLLTDLEMPRLDGLALSAAVRGLPHHKFLPVLVLSSIGPGDVDPGQIQGASVTGWVTKPVEGDDLRRWVRRLLPR
jgi:two-component system chemotaxis response regulator CheY